MAAAVCLGFLLLFGGVVTFLLLRYSNARRHWQAQMQIPFQSDDEAICREKMLPKGDFKYKTTLYSPCPPTQYVTHRRNDSPGPCVLTKQLSCLREPLFGLSLSFDLTSALCVLSGDTGTIKEERGCMNTWMTPSKNPKDKMSCPVSNMTLHCVGIM